MDPRARRYGPRALLAALLATGACSILVDDELDHFVAPMPRQGVPAIGRPMPGGIAPTCTPGDVQPCPCAAGAGSLVCTDQGLWGICACPLCGNGVVDLGEQCEPGPPALLNGASCPSLSARAGLLGCTADCRYDTGLCLLPLTPACPLGSFCSCPDGRGATCTCVVDRELDGGVDPCVDDCDDGGACDATCITDPPIECIP